MEENINMPNELTPEELAMRWRIQTNTLAVWRCQSRGLPWNKRGGKITYSMADILAYEGRSKIIPQN